MERRGMTPKEFLEMLVDNIEGNKLAYNIFKQAVEENEELKKRIEAYDKAFGEIASKSPKTDIYSRNLNNIGEYINNLANELCEIVSPDNLIICEVYKLVKKKMKGEKYE